MAKKKNKDIASQMMDDIISNGNSAPFRTPNSRLSFGAFGDGYYDDDDDDGYDDEYYDPESSSLNGVEVCIETVRTLGNFLSEKDREKIIEKIKANVDRNLRKLKNLNIGDVIYLYGEPDEDEEGEEYLVLMVGMYCDCCGERYKDSRDGQYIDEKVDPTLATSGDWNIYGISPNGAMANFTFDQAIYRGFEIRDNGRPELGDLINEWLGR